MSTISQNLLTIRTYPLINQWMMKQVLLAHHTRVERKWFERDPHPSDHSSNSPLLPSPNFPNEESVSRPPPDSSFVFELKRSASDAHRPRGRRDEGQRIREKRAPPRRRDRPPPPFARIQLSQTLHAPDAKGHLGLDRAKRRPPPLFPGTVSSMELDGAGDRENNPLLPQHRLPPQILRHEPPEKREIARRSLPPS